MGDMMKEVEVTWGFDDESDEGSTRKTKIKVYAHCNGEDLVQYMAESAHRDDSDLFDVNGQTIIIFSPEQFAGKYTLFVEMMPSYTVVQEVD